MDSTTRDKGCPTPRNRWATGGVQAHAHVKELQRLSPDAGLRMVSSSLSEEKELLERYAGARTNVAFFRALSLFGISYPNETP